MSFVAWAGTETPNFRVPVISLVHKMIEQINDCWSLYLQIGLKIWIMSLKNELLL